MLLCPKTAANFRLPLSPLRSAHFSSSPRSPVPSPTFFSLLRSSASPLRPLLAFATDAPSAETAVRAAADVMAATVVEHVVFFKARDGADPAKLTAMVSNLRSLAALDGVLHLAAAPILCHRSSAAADLGFTHLLHSRYHTKEDLAAYSAHSAHVSVVREYVRPVCDDILAVDWVSELDSAPISLRPGSAARVTLAKLAEAAGEAGKMEILAALGGVRALLPGAMEQFSYGENFSLERAKGYSVGSIAVFSSPGELDGLEAKWGDLMEAQKEKVRPLLEGVIVVDFVVPSLPPPPLAAPSGL